MGLTHMDEYTGWYIPVGRNVIQMRIFIRQQISRITSISYQTNFESNKQNVNLKNATPKPITGDGSSVRIVCRFKILEEETSRICRSRVFK